jgi:hypothetical protein
LIREAFIRDFKRNASSRSFGWVVDPLELVEDEVAVRSGHENAVAAEALY